MGKTLRTKTAVFAAARNDRLRALKPLRMIRASRESFTSVTSCNGS